MAPLSGSLDREVREDPLELVISELRRDWWAEPSVTGLVRGVARRPAWLMPGERGAGEGR